MRVLLRLAGGSVAHFTLEAGRTARAVRHRSVEEIWYVLAGSGELWRRQSDREQTVALLPGTCVSIPRGVDFQFRASPHDGVAVVAVTMPPWPGPDEAQPADGPWSPNVAGDVERGAGS